MYRQRGNEICGVLNDFDLAIKLDQTRTAPSSNHRTETLPFMAYEQHYSEWDEPHRFRHDLESLFYVMVLLACNYSGPGQRAAEMHCGSWYTANLVVLRDAKYSLVTKPWFPPVHEFFSGLVPWLHKIRLSLMAGFTTLAVHNTEDAFMKAALVDKSDSGEEDSLVPTASPFDEDTLNGRVSYVSFFKPMRKFEGEPLIIRNPDAVH